jgi:hypothetical protein
MRIAFNRLLGAAPDAATCAIFVIAWVAPARLGPEYVANLMLVMLIEFLVMHSGGFYAGIVASDLSRARRLGALCGLTAFYALFVAGFALAFDSAWPVLAFGWLFVARFMQLWRPLGGVAAQQLTMQWVASGMTYVVGAIATVSLPLPRLGMTPAFVASMHLSGGGEWVERPYTVLAFGALYFAVQAWIKYGALPVQAAGRAKPPVAAARSAGTGRPGRLIADALSTAPGRGDDGRSR